MTSATVPGFDSVPSWLALLDGLSAMAAETEAAAVLDAAVELGCRATGAVAGAALAVDGGAIVASAERVGGVTAGVERSGEPATAHDLHAAGVPAGTALLRAVLRDGSTIRQGGTSLAAADRFDGPCLAVPIRVGGELMGALVVAGRTGGGFDADGEAVLHAIASHAGPILRRVIDLSTARREMVRLREQLGRTEEQLHALDKAKTDFISMASHELRTPLTSILGFASTMLAFWETTPPDDLRNYLEIIDRQAQRLSRMINALLAASRIESGTVTVELDDLDIAEAVEAARSELGPPAEHIAVESEKDLRVRADAGHLHQILVNYLANALKYGEAPVTASARRRDGWVEITVRDSGGGVPPEFVGKMWEKFSQAHTGNHRPTGGAGLGLPIARGLAEAQHGEVWYDAAPGGGAEFGVRLLEAVR